MPNDKKNQPARCLMDATDMPPHLFALSTDGRKNFHQCKSRKALFQVLAKSADPDGAAACPSTSPAGC